MKKLDRVLNSLRRRGFLVQEDVPVEVVLRRYRSDDPYTSVLIVPAIIEQEVAILDTWTSDYKFHSLHERYRPLALPMGRLTDGEIERFVSDVVTLVNIRTRQRWGK